ncbi:uncharacterized protein LOC120370787 [Mauremys reevesii]|uniref:uncharacterized protein LOC120370787 n=1 Tax=Mauremys reevesii TaxID=260615 RepID=UPI00193ED257|nr:uncharacterized protein LOC120370787 [Mauremys reevesii]XP_039341922.1 uncharacterized protein LOC120370787 [Mauremys reevesii]XP_039341923.1 uncharacterized protein LOC120370787 [Mauremys reevesii]XP_039341924.1 uncharacterized protein LOC120370787 [Mauremys reevesii]
MEWEPLGTVRVHSINVSVYYNTTPTKTISFMQQWGKDTDAMLFPGLCQTLNTQGTFCFLITQVTVDAVTTHRRCSTQTKFLCKETFPLTENIICTLVQFTPTHTVNEIISKQGVQVHPQQLWYEPLETIDPEGFKWTILNATLGTIRFILLLTHFQIATIYPNCTRGAAIPLVLQRVWIHKSRKRRDLPNALWKGANSVASAWSVYKTYQHENRLGQLEQAAGFITGAQITGIKAGVGELHLISTLSVITHDMLSQMIRSVSEAGKASQWDHACAEVQEFLNAQLNSIQEDLKHQTWPTALTDTSGVPPDLWPWKHTWRFSGWNCLSSYCSFQAYGPVKGVWAPTYRILPGPWGGCLWDWVIHRDVWEVKPPHGPNRFLLGATGIRPDLWIGLGNLWTLWPLEPPQLQCIRKLSPGEIITIHEHICWEGSGNLTNLTPQPIIQANNSCIIVNSFHLRDSIFNLITDSGTHAIYWPAEKKKYQLSLSFIIPVNWTALVYDRFSSLMSLLPQIQHISQLQGRIHILENIYNTELHAFQTTHRVTTLCTDTDILCFITTHFFISPLPG